MKRVTYSILILLGLSVIMLSAIGSAATIEVKTLPNTYVTIRILPAGEPYSSLQSYYNLNTGSEGKVTVTYSTTLEKVDVELYLKLTPDQTEAELYERYDGLKVSEDQSLDLPKVEGPENVTVESEDMESESEVLETGDLANTAEPSEEAQPEVALTKEVETSSSNSNSPITGQVTSSSIIKSSKSYILYGLGALILVGVVLFGFSFARRSSGPARQPTSHDNKPFFSRSSEEEVREAEYKFAEAQNQLDRAKKIKETESRMAQDAEELRRLRGE